MRNDKSIIVMLPFSLLGHSSHVEVLQVEEHGIYLLLLIPTTLLSYLTLPLPHPEWLVNGT